MGDAGAEVMAAYRGSDADRTQALYAKLSALGPAGEIAVNLLRAAKTSEQAKTYRRRSSSRAAYDTKGWAMGNLCSLLASHGADLGLDWGWGPDADTPGFPWVLYVEPPGVGQISYHARERGADDPDYAGAWDGVRGISGQRACSFAAAVLEGRGGPVATPGRHVAADPGERAGDGLGGVTALSGKDVCPRIIRAATLFSGIGAPEVAMPSWDWLWHAEIEPFPAAVMAARHPGSVNLGDVNAQDFVERALGIGRPDVVVFGSPCQDWSVAGQRAGLDGERGNLALVALRLLRQIRPRWFVFENVPGLLSAYSGSAEAEREVREGPVGGARDCDEDSDFAAFLSAVRECGYLGCWRSLDAQFAGVAQRRERVFFVGSLGGWSGPAAILSVAEGLRWDSAPRREAGERVAPTISARPTAGGGLGTDFDLDGGLIEADVARAVKAGEMGHRHDPSIDNYVVAGTLDAANGRSRGAGMPFDPRQVGGDGNWSNPKVGDPCHPLRGVANAEPTIVAFDETQITHPENRSKPDDRSPQLAASSRPPAVAFEPRARGDDGRGYAREPNFMEDQSPAINATKQPVVAFDCKAGGNTTFAVNDDGTTQALRGDGHGGGHAAIAFSCKDGGQDAGDTSPTLRAMEFDASHANGGSQVAVAFQTRIARNGRGQPEEVIPALNGSDAGATSDMRPCVAVFKPSHFTRGKDGAPDDVNPPLSADADKGDQDPVLMDGCAVRRLTPVECARLQGFPDDYLDIKFRGKSAADGPKYRALGNAMCVPEVRWILQRLERFEREVRR